MNNDSRIALLTAPWALIALLSVRKGTLSPDEFVMPTLIIVTFCAVAAQYVYAASPTSIVFGGLWLLGGTWYYIAAWVPATFGTEPPRLSRLPTLFVLGYIFCEYLRRNGHLRYRLLLGTSLTVAVASLVLTEIGAHSHEHQLTVHLLRAAVLALGVWISLAHWCLLAGKRVLWVWWRQ